MKIWWQSSTAIHEDRLTPYREALTAHLNSVKRDDTEVLVRGVEQGSLDLHFNSTVGLNSFAPGGVLDRLIQAEEEGFDGVAIGCFLDPALQEARELTNIPIFGLAETSIHMACMLGSTFSGVAFCDKQAQYYDAIVRKYGLSDRAVPFASLEMDLEQVQAGFSEPAAVMDLFRKSVKELAAAGVEVILPACGCVNTIVVRDKLFELEGTLVLDINALLLKITEAMVDFRKLTGVTRSRKLLYQMPVKENMASILRTYNFKSAG
jgi:Asp/Glu/hydantoin racemase